MKIAHKFENLKWNFLWDYVFRKIHDLHIRFIPWYFVLLVCILIASYKTSWHTHFLWGVYLLQFYNKNLIMYLTFLMQIIIIIRVFYPVNDSSAERQKIVNKGFYYSN